MTRTIAEKLQIKPNTTYWSSHVDHVAMIEPLPDGARKVDRLDQAAAALVFADDACSLRRLLEAHRDHLTAPAVLWVAYPKGNRTDINRDSLWPILTEYGMRPVSQVAVGEVWSALRFRRLKPGEAPFTGGR